MPSERSFGVKKIFSRISAGRSSEMWLSSVNQNRLKASSASTMLRQRFSARSRVGVTVSARKVRIPYSLHTFHDLDRFLQLGVPAFPQRLS